MFKQLKNQKGMTLVELLAVMVIVGIVAAISIPAIGNLMENTRKDAHVSNAVAVQEAARLYTASAEADLQKHFVGSTAELVFTYDGATDEWTEPANKNLPQFDGYVDNFKDPHNKANYDEATLTIGKTGDVFTYKVSLTGVKVEIASKNPSEMTRNDVVAVTPPPSK